LRTVVWQSHRRRPLVDALARQVGRRSLATWKRIIGEDLSLVPQVQAGIESPRHPGPGLISRREERIVHFQRWLLDRMGSDDVEPCIQSTGLHQGQNQGVSA
jgi:phenylpropionate dioxygenase-like ring-hydroxylating dioxygenase large terminal subunit